MGRSFTFAVSLGARAIGPDGAPLAGRRAFTAPGVRIIITAMDPIRVTLTADRSARGGELIEQKSPLSGGLNFMEYA